MKYRASSPLLAAVFLIACGAPASGQTPLSIEQAVAAAVARYPAVRVSLAEVSAAAAGVEVARTAYLPRVDFLGQVNRATHNNVFGMLLPQPGFNGIAPISGPVLRTNSPASVWGTAVGLMVSWEPFDFGLRAANVEAARAARNAAAARTGVTKLQVAAGAADAYLTLLAAGKTVEAGRASVERARVLNEVVESLVRSELRPGAEASRSRAELAQARSQLSRAEEAVAVARAALAQLVGAAPEAIAVTPGKMSGLPEAAGKFEAAPEGHPLAAAQRAAAAGIEARRKALDRAYFPRFNLQGTTYARGTGVQPDGATGNAASGLGPNIQNWGLGFSLTFSPLDYKSIGARKEVERYLEQAAEARYDQIIQDLRGEAAQARAAVEGARRVAGNTPIQLEAAREAERQAMARYRAGLGTLVEVAEAQRILTQAEIDDALARLSVWRALARLAAVQGDLEPFLAAAR